MKKLLLGSAVCSMLSLTAIAHDNPHQQSTQTPHGQYTGPDIGVKAMTVKTLLAEGKDGQYVTLKGHIVNRIKDKHYTFADTTGQMQVEIPAKHFPPQQKIDATTAVQITGKYDKDLFEAGKLEVKEIKILNN